MSCLSINLPTLPPIPGLTVAITLPGIPSFGISLCCTLKTPPLPIPPIPLPPLPTSIIAAANLIITDLNLVIKTLNTIGLNCPFQ